MADFKTESPLSGDAGVKLIRMGLGSYFMAIASGLIEGVDPSAAFALLLPDHIATFFGTAALLTVSFLVMVGVKLRIAALVLVGLVLCASLAQNLFNSGAQNISAYWRDVSLLFAVMLTYWVQHLSALSAIEGPNLAQALIPAPIHKPRRLDANKMSGSARTPRPDRPKPRKLDVSQFGLRSDEQSGVQIIRNEGQQDHAPEAKTSERKVKAFKPLPLMSPNDPPGENIFVHI